jgi:hypothetical protein
MSTTSLAYGETPTYCRQPVPVRNLLKAAGAQYSDAGQSEHPSHDFR